MTTPTHTRTEALRSVADRIATRDHDADRSVLLTWAENWTDFRAEFVAHGLTADQADAVLFDAVRLRSHPAARASLVFHVAQLRETVERLANLTAGLLDPHEVHDGPAWNLTRWEIAEALLRADIDEALAPLLTGRTA